MQRLYAVLAALLLAGCVSDIFAPISDNPEITDYPLSPAAVKAVERGVTRDLKGATPPLFGPMRAAKHAPGIIYVCGWTAVMTAYGGPVKDASFLATYNEATNGSVLIHFAGSRNMGPTIARKCQEYGAPLP